MPDVPVKIIFTAQLPLLLKKERKYIVACCPVLDVISQGENEEKARKNLAEAISLFFSSCFEHGTLDQVLKECGFSSVPGPQTSAQNIIDVQIPLFMIPEHKQNAGCPV